jgi:uncharacterized protein (TIGR02466 family)
MQHAKGAYRAQSQQGEAMERHIERIFPSVVQISMVEGSQRLNRDLLRKIHQIRTEVPNSRPNSWIFPVYTTLDGADQLHQLPEFAGLQQVILREARSFADALRLSHADHPLRITDCWLNVYGLKDGQEIHQHANNVISGSYYAKAPPGCSGIMFHSPVADTMLVPPYSEINDLNSSAVELPVREGMLVLFRSWLKHSVRPSTTTEERISISFNISM